MRKTNKKVKTFVDPIYDYNFIFCLNWEYKDFKTFMSNKFRIPLDVEHSEGVSIGIFNTNIMVVYVSKNAENFYSTLAHEISHCAIAVFQSKGININMETTEPFAYYVSALMENSNG
jgi:hypothetical protein